MKSIVHPLREDIPVYLGAEGPKNVALAAEIADGWTPLWFSPKSDEFYRAALAEGFGRDGARRSPSDFEIANVCWLGENDDVEKAAAKIKPVVALYAGGMGAKGANFHNDVFARMAGPTPAPRSRSCTCVAARSRRAGRSDGDGRGRRADRACRQDL